MTLETSNAHETSTKSDWPLLFGTGLSPSFTISWTELPSIWLKSTILVNRKIKNIGNIPTHSYIVNKKKKSLQYIEWNGCGTATLLNRSDIGGLAYIVEVV